MSVTTGNDTLSGSNDNDSIDLLAGNDTYLGLDGNDLIFGNDGNDIIYGGNGDDTIAGGNGNDIIYGEVGNDSIDAGAGTFDIIRYNQSGGQAITATINAVGGSSGYNAATVTTASQGNDAIANFEFINGSINNDSFIVNGAATASTLLYLFGGTGNDTITMNVATIGVLADYDAASGNAGFTRGVSVDLAAGYATDYAGTDQLINVRGVNGSSLNDTILGSANDDRFREQGGSDSIDGRGGSDMLDYSGNGSSQSVSANLATGFANDGRGGTDTIISMEFVRGGSGNDTIIGNTADNELRGGSGADIMDGGASGFDVADYANNASSQAISVNLTAGRANDGLGGTDTLSSIEYIRGGSGNDTMVGSDANERFRGNAGNDSVDGGNGTEDILDLSPTSAAVSASLVTGQANDGLGGTDGFTGIEVVYSGTGADTLIGGAGNEIFDGGMGGDLIDGGLGADRVRYYVVNGNNSSVTRGVSVDLAAQRATDGWGGADTLIGIERVTGTNFADTLLGDNVSNRFNGFAGNDTIDGGLGGDILEYSNNSATAGVSVNLTTGVASDGTGGVDVFTSIENVSGASFGDHLTGIAQLGRTTSYLTGGAGSDTLVGIEGEFVTAGYTDQTSALSVNLASGSVNDGLGGIDLLINIRGAGMGSGNFADTLIGSNGNDWLSPGGGNDTIVGGDGFDILAYSGSTDHSVSVNLAAGLARDDNGGTDNFIGIEGVTTGYSNDTVIGNSEGNLIALNAGADSADAAGGQDTISYSLGFSPFGRGVIINEAGDQSLFAGVTINLAAGRATDQTGGTDTILNFEAAIGSTMHDSILGSNGNEMFDGAERNDTINAGGGDDTIVGGDGNDLLMGGAGNDLYLMAAATGNVIIDDASGNDTVSLAGLANDELLASEISSVAGIDAFDLVGGGDVILHLTAARASSVSGTGLFRVFGSGGDRLIFDDTGWARTGSSSGFDTLSNSAGNATVIASTGIVSSDIGSVVNGGEGNDTLGGGNGADTIDGGNGSDIIAGLGGSDSMPGGDGNDSVNGGDGADTVLGGLGNDLIFDGNGADRYDGGAGSDMVIFAGGAENYTIDYVTTGTAPNNNLSVSVRANSVGVGGPSDLIQNVELLRFSNATVEVDAAGQHDWSGIATYYDAQGRLDWQRVNYDTVNYVIHDWDNTGVNDWSSVSTNYDAQGRLDWQGVFYDAGNSALIDWDNTSQIDWSSVSTNYDAQGRLDWQHVNYDNGTFTANDWDNTSQNEWSSVSTNYDGQGRPDWQRVNYDTVNYVIHDWDNTGVNDWSSVSTNYDAQGRLDWQGVFYDAGNSALIDWDNTSQIDWSSVSTNYDAQGRLDWQGVYYDAGNSALNDWDNTSQYDWSSMSIYYDAQNRLDWQLVSKDDGSLVLNGGSASNQLNGGASADTLDGSAGDDTLVGNAGNDLLIGGSGGDQFLFNTALGSSNVDTISDYSSADDTILLDDAIFAGIGVAGTGLAADAFTLGAAATTSAHRIIYNSDTGALFYDADGAGAGTAIQWATLTVGPLGISNTEFLIV